MRPTACLIILLFVQTAFSQSINSEDSALNSDIKNNQSTRIDLNKHFISSSLVKLDADLFYQIKRKAMDTLAINAKVAEDVKVYVDNKSKRLTVHNPNLKEILKLKIYNLKGTVIIDEDHLAIDDLYQYTTSKLHDGVYVASLKLANNEKLNQKLFIKKIP